MLVWSKRCAARGVHCICCGLTNRLLTTLVDFRFNGYRPDPFAVSPSLAEVWNELAVALDADIELRQPVCYLLLTIVQQQNYRLSDNK